MRTTGTGARPGANKPFLTEYKLSYKDPGHPGGRKGGVRAGNGASPRKTKVLVLSSGNGPLSTAVTTNPTTLNALPVPTGAGVAKNNKDALVAAAGMPAAGVGSDKDEKENVVTLPQILPGPPMGMGAKAEQHKATKKDIWQPPPYDGSGESTSLTLPGMMTNEHHPSVHFKRKRILGGATKTGHEYTARYNIISADTRRADAL
ncbi:hypothetical protein HK101_009029 [Irineochytrium annulatum]|nr:hypothetical protein HK101_009029 [Irineochytrium annulatum]